MHYRLPRYLAVPALVLLALAGLRAEPSSSQGWSPHLRRYPYLTDLVGPYVTINWATDQAYQTAKVTWGRAGSEPCTHNQAAATRTAITVNSAGLYQWKAQLELSPDSDYCYRIYLGPDIDLLGSDRPQFRTQLPAGSPRPFSFAVFGDWGRVDGQGQNPEQARILALLAQSGARFALTSGDNSYPAGSQTNYGDLVQSGPGISAVFGPQFWAVAGASIALFPSIGNHDLRADAINPYLINWPQDRAVAGSGGRYARDLYCCLNGTTEARYPSAWYAFNVGTARFYVLHSAWGDLNNGTATAYANDYAYHWAPESAEYHWLERDLAAHPAKLKFAVFHYPLYSDSSFAPTNAFLQGSHSLEGLLSRYGVAITFSGHSHTYQRHRNPVTGIVSYVTGGGGAHPMSVGTIGCSPGNIYAIGWSHQQGRGQVCGAAAVPATPQEVFHFLLVHVDGKHVTVEPINSRGERFDRQVYDFTRRAGLPLKPGIGAPSGLSAAIAGSQGVRLTWGASADSRVSGYVVYRDDSALASVDAATTSLNDEAALPGTSYRYSVYAVDQFGKASQPSPIVTVHTPLVIWLPLVIQGGRP